MVTVVVLIWTNTVSDYNLSWLRIEILAILSYLNELRDPFEDGTILEKKIKIEM